MKRGDVVLVAASGDDGKPRPAVVVQSDLYNPTHASVTLCLITSDLQDAPLIRLTLEPTRENGLKSISQIMADKIVSVRRERIGKTVGRLSDDDILRLNRSMLTYLGLL
jgi:mRNA interferase MazF